MTRRRRDGLNIYSRDAYVYVYLYTNAQIFKNVYARISASTALTLLLLNAERECVCVWCVLHCIMRVNKTNFHAVKKLQTH